VRGLDGLDVRGQFRWEKVDEGVLGRLFNHSVVSIGAAAIEAIGQIQRALSHAAAETIVLASSEKLNPASPYKIVGLEELSGLITERTADDAQIKTYQGNRNFSNAG